MAKLKDELTSFYRYLATSDDELPKGVRAYRRKVLGFEITPNKAVLEPLLYAYIVARNLREHGKRVLVCQPLFRAYCKECGPGLRTGDFVHWVQGDGDIVVGSNVWLDGKSSITFAARFADRPTLIIGDNTAIGHETDFIVGKRITIGKNVNISGASRIFDSSGHPSDPVARRNHEPPPPDSVRPVTIGDDVWIGKNCLVFPGVRIGEGSIISAGSVVRRHVPPYSVVAGNPAQVVLRLPKPGADGGPGSVRKPTDVEEKSSNGEKQQG
jgi:acetyltransferase-like isoleucine patch superfamily enzyme